MRSRYPATRRNNGGYVSRMGQHAGSLAAARRVLGESHARGAQESGVSPSSVQRADRACARDPQMQSGFAVLRLCGRWNRPEFRTGLADFPHSALRQDVTPSPTARCTHACGQAYETVMPVEVREWIRAAPASPDLVLETQPPAFIRCQPGSPP